MSTRTIRPANHRCAVGTPIGRHGAIVECGACGRWWRAVEPGNPRYAGWRRAWIRQLVARAGGER